MRRDRDVRRRVAGLVALASTLTPLGAFGQVTLAGGDVGALEQRVAVALGPSRTVLWVAVHARPDAGPFAVVVPARAGASLDLATDAWLESLEAVTAPRVLPPDGVSAVCPGDPQAEPVHVTGDLAHHAPLTPAETITLAGAGDLLLWAAENDLTVPGPVASALADADATHFVALRFAAPGGDVWTPTVRVAFAEPRPVLPLGLTRAGSADATLTVFAMGAGAVELDGARVAIDPSTIAFDVAHASSDYAQRRAEALGARDRFVVESSSHDVLVTTGALPGGDTIPALVNAYFERAASLGAATGAPATCASVAAAAIARPDVVGAACPRADLGVVDGAAACVESPEATETDPSALRCGGDSDDLALALSGLAGRDAWLTRMTLRLSPDEIGEDRAASTAPGPEVEPVLVAGSVDFSQCGEGGAGGGGAATSSSGASGAGPSGAGPTGSGAGPGGFTTSTTGGAAVTYVEVPVRLYDTSCGCSGDYTIVEYVTVPEDEAPEGGSYYAEDDGCGSDTSESYDSSNVESSPSEDGCSGDTSGSSDTAGSDEDCSGESSDTSSSSSDDGCGSDTSDSSDDSGCGCDDESVGAPAGSPRARQARAVQARPRFSVLAFGLAMFVAPLRRATRKRRRT